jgi:adenine phosphoribosyltransferase
MDELRRIIRDVPDFPKKGIVFKDITPVLADAEAFKKAIDAMAESLQGRDFDLLVGIESRGFIFAAALAYMLGKGKVPVRKPGKLPAKTVQVSYELEYGTDRLEIHHDAIRAGQGVVIVDDVLATGGTARGTANLVEKVGGEVVALSFFIELEFLRGRDKLAGFDVRSVLSYR